MNNKKKSIVSIITLIIMSVQLLLPVNVFAKSQYKTMYVVSSYKWHYYVGSNGDSTTKFSYKNGLVSIRKSPYGPIKYKYDSKGRIINDTYTYDSKGRLVSDGSYYYSYDSAGRLIKEETCYNGEKSFYKSYSYKKNKLVSTKTYVSEDFNIKYDKKGFRKSYNYNVKISGRMNKFQVRVKNTYKKGRLVKSVYQYKKPGGRYESSYSISFKYKKVKVPKKFVAKVKAQQRYLKNQNEGPFC